MENLTFGTALNMAKDGELIRRKDWMPNQFAFMRPSDTIPPEIVGGIRSIPQKAREVLMKHGVSVFFSETLCLFTPGLGVVNGYAPTQYCMVQEDWEVYEKPAVV